MAEKKYDPNHLIQDSVKDLTNTDMSSPAANEARERGAKWYETEKKSSNADPVEEAEKQSASTRKHAFKWFALIIIVGTLIILLMNHVASQSIETALKSRTSQVVKTKGSSAGQKTSADKVVQATRTSNFVKTDDNSAASATLRNFSELESRKNNVLVEIRNAYATLLNSKNDQGSAEFQGVVNTQQRIANDLTTTSKLSEVDVNREPALRGLYDAQLSHLLDTLSYLAGANVPSTEAFDALNKEIAYQNGQNNAFLSQLRSRLESQNIPYTTTKSGNLSF